MTDTNDYQPDPRDIKDGMRLFEETANAGHQAMTPPDTKQLIERLRMIRGTQFTPIENALVTEAADEIERLDAELRKLREASK